MLLIADVTGQAIMIPKRAHYGYGEWGTLSCRPMACPVALTLIYKELGIKFHTGDSSFIFKQDKLRNSTGKWNNSQ